MSTVGTIGVIFTALGLVALGLVSATVWSDRRPRELSTRERADLARLRAPYAPERDSISGEHVGPGRHRYGVANGSCAQAARWNSTTGQFNIQFDGLRDLNWSPEEQDILRSVST